MAATIEDILMRRTGLQFYSWDAAIAAAAPAGELLGAELGWTPDQMQSSVDAYVGRIRRLQNLAGLPVKPAATAS
jgi:glycerol-3-phosphate dehydrogenase